MSSAPSEASIPPTSFGSLAPSNHPRSSLANYWCGGEWVRLPGVVMGWLGVSSWAPIYPPTEEGTEEEREGQEGG
jgi:hypothetical protein